MYDLIIVGAGPAGITAAIYAARKKIRTLVIAKLLGGQAALSGDIENYTGYQVVTGAELSEKFEEHLKKFDLEVKSGEEAKEITRLDGGFRVTTTGGSYESRAVIVATGAKPRPLNVPGEKEFRNRGVSYCATCDAPLFQGANVAVVGGGNSAMDAGLQLAKIAKKVFVVNINPALSGDEVLRGKLLANRNVEVHNKAKALEVKGKKLVEGLRVSVAGKERTLAVEGVFVEIGWTPSSDLLKGVDKNEKGEIVVGPEGQTTVPGLFAAGDVTSIEYKQIIVAAGEGAKAALSAAKYLSTTK